MKIELTEESRRQLRKLIEGICLHDVKTARNALASLLQNKLCVSPEEDYIVVAFNEAITTGKLNACDDVALAISWLIKAYKHRVRRNLLLDIADGLTDINNENNPEWATNLIMKESDVPLGCRENFWGDLKIVVEVRQLFRQAGFSTALDERCSPVLMMRRAPVHA